MPHPATVFLLGRTPEIAAAELAAVLPQEELFPLTPQVLRCPAAVPDATALLSRLGGTVKIGYVLAKKFTPAAVADAIAHQHSGGKALFAISWVDGQKNAATLAAGLNVKTLLKQRGINARLVTSRAPQLPAAAINRHGAREFTVLSDGSVARIVAAQDVDDFTRRDVGRPHRDVKSGTLPPKLARMMVNLARVGAGTLLDPFCGSGTVLSEAMLSDVASVLGSDVSAKAVAESQANLRWLQQQYPETAAAHWQVFIADVRQLEKTLGRQKVAAVVTEPYLGPPRRGRETRAQLQQVVNELMTLYTDAFGQFAKVLSVGGRVVFAQPSFTHGGEVLKLELDAAVTQLGFTRTGGPYPYHRPDQHVLRSISVWARI
ncbi:MAG: RsmD family RNA methyltransferase [bacterium]|nr:RsmD family RNA methyltransferase [bacterium]